jgi:hypothetical protein
MSSWSQTFPANQGAENISIRLDVSEGTRTTTSVVVNYSLWIQRTVGTGFFQLTSTGTWNTASVTIAGSTFAHNNFTYDFRTGSGTFRQFLIGSGSHTVSASSPTTISVGATATTSTNPPGTATISPQSFGITPFPVTPVWSTAAALTAAVRNRSVSRTVVASPVTSYQLLSSSGQTGGLSVSNNAISGTPTTVGTATYVFRANNTNAAGTASADRTFTLAILSTPPKVWTTSFVDGLLRVWNGSSWVRGRIRVWNGSAWVDSK